MGTVILAVALYLALTIISLSFESKNSGDDFANDENLEELEKKA